MAAKQKTKGELTSSRILDAAEAAFASGGYDGTSLRQIAKESGIKEPGLYNYFAGKQALYEAVLFRALNHMAEAMTWHLEQARELRDYTDLPSVMTDLLLDHPQIAALFQQALLGDKASIGTQLVHAWLEKLFSHGLANMAALDSTEGASPESLAINVIAMFNLTTGYFLAQRAYETMANGELTSPENIARQKKLLHRVVRAMLVS